MPATTTSIAIVADELPTAATWSRHRRPIDPQRSCRTSRAQAGLRRGRKHGAQESVASEYIGLTRNRIELFEISINSNNWRSNQ